MDPTTRFFAKLRKLAVTLESETAKLQHAFESRNDDGDSETTARAMRAYHELNCDVGNLKGQIQEQLAQQKAHESEVSSFIKACRVMEQKVSQDINTLRGHWETYGYQAPRDTQRASKTDSQESHSEDEECDESETKSDREVGSGEEAEDDHSSSPTKTGAPPFADAMRTPQLSDFGLSEIQLKRTLAGAEWCSEVPPMPEMSLPHPSLNTPAPPPMPLTPKCALRMDDDELQTPQMHDFGITEHTMCLNNDFTMNLFQKKVNKPARPQKDIPTPPVNPLMESLQAKADNLKSPEPPVFCTPGFKIRKTNETCPTTPEVPAFQTPYVNRLVSNKKSSQQPEPINMEVDDDSQTFKLQTSPAEGSTGSKRAWEYNVSKQSILGGEEKHMPEMPNLESVWANNLQSRSAKMLKTGQREKVTKEPTVSRLELDGPTQEFSLGTPRIRTDFEEPSTPEMPDLSSVTQDICKLVSQAHLKKTATMVVHSYVKPEKAKNSAPSVSAVSKSEFQSLPSYLKQMTLHNLNQAIHSINNFTAECPGEKTEFQMEELGKMLNLGAKTPVYILCLMELKRLIDVGGARSTSVYKLSTAQLTVAWIHYIRLGSPNVVSSRVKHFTRES
ncbi:Spindle and kinetochore-associated protein 3 [Larimichthys crocea]|uniref:Spindle and kinetochore-associated protein 3 n=1 Tax=Larimichthys crocea TaxID=215358 RepID=A0A6G0J884_LARCR|nr:Spindle and kinetochore-associated protein 3 [Larimichthys crocea]